MRQFLPLLLLLACPLMMVFMMRGGHGHGASHEGRHTPPGSRRSRARRIDDLEREVATLRDEPDETAPSNAGRR